MEELERRIYKYDFKPTRAETEEAKKILGIDYDPHPQCVRCALYHAKIKGLPFQIKCKPLPADFDADPITRENIHQKMLEDPDVFAKVWLDVILRQHQRELLRCTAKRRVFRLPRRAGKTFALAIYAVWKAMTNPSYQILFATMREDRVYEFFDEINRLIRESELARNFVTKLSNTPGIYYRKKPAEFKFTNGSVIKAFTLSEEQGGTAARGRSGDIIILDEADYINRDAIVAFLGILGTSPHTEFLAASTPSQVKGFFWSWCNDPFYKEFHWRYQDLDIYNPEQDAEWKRMYSKEEYEREVLAEFAFSEKGVFNPKLLERAIEEYAFDDEENPPAGVYSIGVDWNESVAGVHIVIVRYEKSQWGHKIRVSNIIRVPPSEFTQIDAVERIMKLFEKYKPIALVVDEGYGNTQIQMLRAKAMDRGLHEIFEPRFHVVNFGSKIRVPDAASGQLIDVYVKPFMVSIVSRYLESNQLILPASEDYRSGLVGQMRNYQVEAVTEKGIPKYSKENVHTLEAFMLALFGLWQNAELLRLYGASTSPRIVSDSSKPLGIVRRVNPEYQNMHLLYEKRHARRWIR